MTENQMSVKEMNFRNYKDSAVNPCKEFEFPLLRIP